MSEEKSEQDKGPGRRPGGCVMVMPITTMLRTRSGLGVGLETFRKLTASPGCSEGLGPKAGATGARTSVPTSTEGEAREGQTVSQLHFAVTAGQGRSKEEWAEESRDRKTESQVPGQP